MRTVVIVGVASALGTRLATRLGADERVDRVIGIDSVPPEHVNVPGVVFHLGDPASAPLEEPFEGADAVIHAVDLLAPVRSPELARRGHLDAGLAVLEAAARAGVPHVLLTSTSLVYGAHPDNDVPLTERSRLRGIPGFAAAEHALELERAAVRRSGTDGPTVTVLRFAPFAGPGVDSVLSRVFEAPCLPAVRGHRPPLQFLHPDDAVDAVAHLLDTGLGGVFNVSADGWLSYVEVAQLVGRRPLEVPEEIAFTGAAGVYALGLGDLPPGLVAVFTHPCLVSNAALTAAGWQPRFTNREALAALVEEHRSFVTLGAVRMRWRTLLVTTALASVAKGALLWWALRCVGRARSRRAEAQGPPSASR